MVDALKYIKSKWLKWEMIDGEAPLVAEIESVKPGKYEEDDEDVLCVTFLEYKVPLGLNNTNLKKLVELFGRDTREWIGQRVTLQVEPVAFGGKVVNGIRIAEAETTRRRKASPRKARAKKAGS